MHACLMIAKDLDSGVAKGGSGWAHDVQLQLKLQPETSLIIDALYYSNRTLSASSIPRAMVKGADLT